MCLLWLYLFVINVVFGFNFDTNFPIVYTDPYSFNGYRLQMDSYFGYSVVLYNGGANNEPWIQIGAPRGPNPYSENKTTGVVFRCGIKRSCYHLSMNTWDEHGYPDEAFFGNSMDISPNNEIYATCGHRWIYKTLRDYYIQGACFAGHTNENDTTFVRPLEHKDNQILKIGNMRVYNKAQAQIGFSAQFSKKSSELLVGLPGMLNWKGSPALLSRVGQVNPARRINKRSLVDELDELTLPDASRIDHITYFDLAGYSVTSGKFYDHSLYFVTGAPRSASKGSVIIFRFTSDNNINVAQKIDGHKFGEYFGSSITSPDINGDGLDDLIVGAPFHKGSGTESKYDVGAVYIYLGSKDKLVEASTSTITGKSNAGRFGESMMSLGDIDKDGCDDIAVAAPYENDNSGVVYIFRGDKQIGLIKEPSQIINGKEIIPNVKGFGISFSKPTDIDNNKYSDVAIGAYKSGHAILLRGKPVVVLKHQLTSSVSQIRVENKALSFNFTSCVSYSGEDITQAIRIVRTLSVDKEVTGRAYLENPTNSSTEMSVKDKNYCETYTVTIKESNKNIFDPIVIKASVDLEKRIEHPDVINIAGQNTGNDQFCSSCPILRKTDDTDKQISIDFNRGCGDDNVCNSNLFLSATFRNLENAIYVVGSKTYITMEATVRNMEENAFQTEIQIVLPNPVRLRSMPSYCKESGLEISCSIDNPLAPNVSKTVSLELDLDEVNTGKYQNVLDFLLKVSTSSNNYGEKEKKLSLNLVKNADVELIGKSSEETYSYINRTYGKADFQQIFQVLKYDISPIQKVELKISVPVSINVNGADIEVVSLYLPKGTLAGQPVTCRGTIPFKIEENTNIAAAEMEKKKRRRRDISMVDEILAKYPANRTIYINCTSPDVSVCNTVVCDLGPFKNVKNIADIKLKMTLDISGLTGYMPEKDIVIVSTSAEISVSDNVSNNNIYNHVASIASVFIGPSAEKFVDSWIIIVAIISGILLLLIVAGVLYKIGFFKRTKKEMLLNAKKNAGDQAEPLHEEDEE